MHTTLAELAEKGELKALDDRWLEAMEQGARPRKDMLATIKALKDQGKDDRARDLGWTWLEAEKERGPADALAVARELILILGDTDEFRQELIELYEQAYADRPELSQLIDESGLRGGKTARRAMRTLDICLELKEGDHLIARSDEHAAQVVEIDRDLCEYTIKTKRGTEMLDADALALAYDPVDPNDFRILSELRPGEIGSLLVSDPVGVVVGILRSHQGRLDSDELEHLLVPRFLSEGDWGKWWTKARTGLKRCPNVVLEGRNPVILTWHEEEKTLEDELLPLWAKAETPGQRLAFVDSLFREARTRQVEPDRRVLQRLLHDLMQRVNATRQGSPSEALTEALIIDRLVELAGELEHEDPAHQILAEHPDVIALVSAISENALYLRALDRIQGARPGEWAEIYLNILPVAPASACERIAKALAREGHEERVRQTAAEIVADFDRHLDAVCWLWKGSSIKDLSPLSRREMLPRLLEYLGDVNLNDRLPGDRVRHVRQLIRNTLSADSYKPFREIIEGMEPGMAWTIQRTVDRLDGLGQTVQMRLLAIIREIHPQKVVRRQVDPWSDDSLIYATAAGLDKRQEELNHLINVKMKENAKAIGEAASHGDLSENSEYKFALEERDLLQARAAKIQNEISIARVVGPGDVNTESIDFGSRAHLVSTDGEVRRAVTVLGPFESNMEENIYNYRAPLSMRLRGLRIGDTITLDLDGTEREFRVERIESAIAH